MLAHRNRGRVWRNLTDEGARLVAYKCGRDFHFCVLWKVFCARQIEGAARGIETEHSLLHAAQSGGYVVRVAQEKVCGIDEHGTAVFSGYVKSEHHGLGERLLDGLLLVGVIGDGAEGFVRFHHQDTRAGALKFYDVRTAALSAIEAEVVLTNSRGQ